ncbi:MAG: hypothetical protein WCE75_11795 [Terracidiphilus sp.]
MYPMPCSVVWSAVMDTLGNGNDYRIVSVSDEAERAAFTVVGSLRPYTDTVALTSVEGGCAMRLVVLQVGSDNSDERGFRKRFGKALAKRQAEQPAKPPESTKS